MDEIFTVLIVGLIVGVTPSMFVLFLKEKKFDPEKWKKDTIWQLHAQKLEVYGQLKTLLDTGKQRMKRQNSTNQNNEDSHLLMVPEDYETLKNIFGKYRYILSHNLVELYLEFIKNDKYFSDVSSKKNKIKGRVSSLDNKKFNVDIKSGQTTVIYCNLKDLEKTVTDEYDALNIKYNKMIS